MRDRDYLRKRAAFDQRKTERKRFDILARIEALTRNARTTWFSLLAVLVFVGVTLMGVSDIDFYGVDRATQLPFVNVSVPTKLFFVVSPILIFSAYAYFHLYLIRLLDELGGAAARIEGKPLGQSVTPWLVTDAALHLRNQIRRDGSRKNRPLEWPAKVFNTLLAWGFGIVVLGAMWWTSMPARSIFLTGTSALMLVLAIIVGGTSYVVMNRRMQGLGAEDPIGRRTTFGLLAGGICVTLLIGILTISKTRDSPAITNAFVALEHLVNPQTVTIERGGDPLSRAGPVSVTRPRYFSEQALTLANINLRGRALVDKPADWLPHGIAHTEFSAQWCRREAAGCDNLSDEQRAELADEWAVRRASQIGSLRKPSLRPGSLRGLMDRLVRRPLDQIAPRGPDLRRADLQGAFMAGMALSHADLTDANLQEATLEAAELDGATLRGVTLDRAHLETARLAGATLDFASGVAANLTRVDLGGATLSNTVLSELIAPETNLNGATFRETVLMDSDLTSADFRKTVAFNLAILKSDLRGSDFSFSLLTGTPESPSWLAGVDLRGSTNKGGALRHAGIQAAQTDGATDWRDIFLDGTVDVPDELGGPAGRPCHWLREPLSEVEFLGAWRAWIERSRFVMLPGEMPEPLAGITARQDLIPEGCRWSHHEFGD